MGLSLKLAKTGNIFSCVLRSSLFCVLFVFENAKDVRSTSEMEDTSYLPMYLHKYVGRTRGTHVARRYLICHIMDGASGCDFVRLNPISTETPTSLSVVSAHFFPPIRDFVFSNEGGQSKKILSTHDPADRSCSDRPNRGLCSGGRTGSIDPSNRGLAAN
jgi:hypothetical protein